MEESYAEFECECRVKTEFEYKKPEMLKGPVFKDVPCRGCGAIWEMRFRWSSEGTMQTFRLKSGSQKLADILLKRKTDKLINAPQKKSPIIVVPSLPGLKG